MKQVTLKVGDKVKVLYIAHTIDGKRTKSETGTLVAWEPTWSTVQMANGQRRAVPTHQIYPMAGKKKAA